MSSMRYRGRGPPPKAPLKDVKSRCSSQPEDLEVRSHFATMRTSHAADSGSEYQPVSQVESNTRCTTQTKLNHPQNPAQETTARALNRLEALPPELHLAILSHLSILTELSAIIHASPRVHQIYAAHRAAILSQFVIRKLERRRTRECRSRCFLFDAVRIESKNMSPCLPHLKEALVSCIAQLLVHRTISRVKLPAEQSMALLSVEHICRWRLVSAQYICCWTLEEGADPRCDEGGGMDIVVYGNKGWELERWVVESDA